MKKTLMIVVAVAALFQIGIALAAVNINTASVDQLAQLKGIGSVKAAAIVADRKANGNYKSLEQLTRVPGIGEKTVSDLKDAATVGDTTPSVKSDTQGDNPGDNPADNSASDGQNPEQQQN